MSYRDKFGFGCMRLPLIDKDDETSINQDLFNEMVDLYMSKGFNYFDTSYAYHEGVSELAIKKAVVDRYPRKSFEICDKMPTWELKSPEDNEKFVNLMLKRLGIEYFDVFLIHNINIPWLNLAEKYNTFDYVQEMKENGIAKKIGFSFHEKSDLLEKVLNKYGDMFDIVQLELNYLDWEDLAIESHKCYDLCVKHDLDVYVMEPLKGGVIVNQPKSIENDFKSFNPDKSIASFALRFCASLKNVKKVLSGMNKMDDLVDNCETFENFEVLNEVEREFLLKQAERLRSILEIPCSECEYCIGSCPADIPIPEYFSLYNLSKQQKESNMYRLYYDKLVNETVSPKECIECEACIDYCTQQINIPKELKIISKYFNDGFTPYD